MSGDWGGAREGAGRKRLSPTEKKQGVTFHLSQSDLDFISQYEGENRSERLRNLIRDLRERIEQT